VTVISITTAIFDWVN